MATAPFELLPVLLLVAGCSTGQAQPPSASGGGSSGGASCGFQTCTADQLCVHPCCPCCTQTPIACAPMPESGVCDAGAFPIGYCPGYAGTSFCETPPCVQGEAGQPCPAGAHPSDVCQTPGLACQKDVCSIPPPYCMATPPPGCVADGGEAFCACQ